MGEPLVGREHELKILTRLLNETTRGRGAVVLISGEPGIGKSALIGELCLRAEALRFRVMRTACASQHLPGFDSPWVHIIRNIVAWTPPNEVDSQWLSDCPTFGGQFEATGGTIQSLDTLDDSALFRSLWRLFQPASRGNPLLLAVDDLQNADESTLRFLQFGGRGFDDLRVMLVAAYSLPLTTGSCRVRSAIESIRRPARRIQLNGLSPSKTGELLRQVLRDIPDEPVIRRIYDLTSGNPGFVLETAYSRLGQGKADSSNPFPQKVPEAIRATIEERLGTLSHETRELLAVASIVGETFSTQLLLSIVPFDRDQALAALLEAEAAGFIRPVPRDRYRFVKGFVKKVLHEQFSSTERARLHRRIATTLEACPNKVGEVDAGDVALHLFASRDTNSIQRALELAQLAGSRSVEALDYQGAIIMYSIALEALDLSGHSDERRRCDILIALAEAEKHAGDIPAAQESLHHAAEIAQRLGDWSRLSDIVLAAPVLHWPFPGRPNGLVTMLAERILCFLPERDVTRRALVMARWAAELSHLRDERKHSEQLSARALEMLEESHADEATKLKLLRLRDWVLHRPELISESLVNSAEMTRIARRLGDWPAVFEGEWAQKVSLFELGSAAGLDDGREPLEHAALMAGPKHQCYVLAFRGVQAVFDGRFAEGEQLFAACSEMAVAYGLTELPDKLWPTMMMPLDEQGRLAELEPVVARWSRASATSTSVRVIRCWLAAKLGRTSEARFHLERLATDGFGVLKDSKSMLVGAAALTEVCTELGDVPHHAAVLYHLLRPHEKHHAVFGLFAAFGSVHRYLGKLALSLSDPDQAIRHLQAAIEFNNRIGARAWTAYASNELAVALLARNYAGDRRVALFLLANAHAEALSMKMERLARTIRACVDRLELVDSDLQTETNGSFKIISHATAESNATAGLQARSHLVLSLPLPLTNNETEFPSQMPADQPAPSAAMFCFEADHWSLGYGGRVMRLGHLKGLNLIAHLLSRPNQQIHALELDGLVGLGPAATSNGIDKPAGALDLGPLLDQSAKQAYRQRIQELREDLEEARSFNDFERAARIDEEICAISRELTRAVGLTGRDRRMASEAERARLRVTNSIRWAINKISGQHRGLGRFLALSIKTGTLCSYVPDSTDCPDWKL